MSEIVTKKVVRETEVFLFENKEYPTMVEAQAARRDKDLYDQIMKQFSAGERDRTGYYVIKTEGAIDYGDRSSPRVLGYAFGRPGQVVRHALTLSGFIGYGPGIIEKIDIKLL